MKQFITTITFSFALILGSFQMVNAQECITFNEDDFAAGNTCATETDPNPGVVTTNTLDVWDATAGTSGMDGLPDVQLCYEAKLFNPNANGTCNDGDFTIGAGWGGDGHQCGGTGTSDFGATTSDDCVDEHGIIIMTTKFMNGFCPEAGTYMFNATSQNGSSEGYEYGFGFVTMATDANGNPITGLNTQAAVCAALATYGNTEYAGGTTASMHALTSMTGIFTTQADDLNATANDCATSGQNGEDTGSGSGPNSSLNTGVSGLAPTDIIKEVTYIYGFSNAVGTDCDGDGDVGVGTNPSGSFAGMEVCPAPPACGYTGTINDFVGTEVCGEFSFDMTEIVGMGTTDDTVAPGVKVSTDGGATFAPYVFGDALPADGATMYIIRLCDPADATCFSDFGPFTAPVGTAPNTPTFVPCTTGTTGIGGN